MYFMSRIFRCKCLRVVFLLGSSFLVLPGNAQDTETDTLAIVSFADKFIIKANFSTQTDTYRYRVIQTGERLDLTSNTSLRLSLSLDYEFIGGKPRVCPGVSSQ